MSVGNDPVNHPAHYTTGNIEVIEAIEDWQLGFHLGNAIKYIARAKHKGREKEDIKKAIWYLNRYLESIAQDTSEEAEKHIQSIKERDANGIRTGS